MSDDDTYSNDDCDWGDDWWNDYLSNDDLSDYYPEPEPWVWWDTDDDFDY